MAGNVTQETNVVIRGKDNFTPAAQTAIGSLDRLSNKAAAASKKVEGSFAKFGAGLKKDLRQTFFNTAKVAGAAAVGLSALSVNAFADYEKALVGVGKTSNLEGEELRALGDRFKALSARIPASSTELLGIAQTAAQLGVTGSDNLERFTLTIAKLASASDIVGEEGASQLARILTLTGEGGANIGANIEKFGSVLVALGNKMPATESQIASMANELARTFGQFGGSSTDIAGLAGAMASLGFRAEESGGVINQVFAALDKHTRAGSAGLSSLVHLTGMQGDELRKAFEDDATSVFIKFVEGLKKSKDQGVNVAEGLQRAFGLSGVRVTGILGGLSTRFDVLKESMKLANDEAARGGGALNEEADKAFNTTSAKMEIFKNKMQNLGIQVGMELAPAFIQALERLTPLITFAAQEVSRAVKALTDANFATKLKDGATEIAADVFGTFTERGKERQTALIESVRQKTLVKKAAREAGVDLSQPPTLEESATGLFDQARTTVENTTSFTKVPEQKVVIELKGDTSNVKKVDASRATQTQVNFNAGFQ